MARSVQFVLYDPKTGAPVRDNVPVKVYEVATTGRPNALPTTTVLTNALGVVIVGGLDDAKVYDFVLQTNPRVHQNEFNNQSIKVSTLSLTSLTLTSLTVTGLSTLATAAITQLGVSGNLDVTGTLTVTGATSLKNNLDVAGTFAVTGATTLRSTLDVTGALAVTGAVTLRSTLSIAGAATGSSSIANNRLRLYENVLYEYLTNGVAEIAVNYAGYNYGTTQFRNVQIYDGKNASVALFQGSDKAARFYGTTYVPFLSLESSARVGSLDAYSPFDWQGAHATTQLKMHAYSNGSTQDAWLYLWASEGGATFDGCGIGNNYRYGSTGWARETTGRGGSYIRLLNNAIYFNTVGADGVVTNRGFFDSTFGFYAALASIPTLYIGNSLLSDSHWREVATNGLATLNVNYNGYAGGTTQFRNFDIYDGKQARVASFAGNGKVLTVDGYYSSASASGVTHYFSTARIGHAPSGAAGYMYLGAVTALDATDHYALAQGNSDGQHTYLNSRPSADVKFANHGALQGGVDSNGIYVDDGKRLGLEGSGGDTYFKRNGATIEAYIDGTRRAYLDSTGWHW